MKHWYFGVRCKSCKLKIPIKYIGTGNPHVPAGRGCGVFRNLC